MNRAEKPTILVVDDIPANIELLAGLLRDSYRVKAALNGPRALSICAGDTPPDLVLLDVMMPGMDGFEVCRLLKADPETARMPVIFVTARDRLDDEQAAMELGAVDYITKPVRPAILFSRIRSQLALYFQQRELDRLKINPDAPLQESWLTILRRLARAAEQRDIQAGQHVMRMSHYAQLIAQRCDSNPAWATLVFEAAPMHDVGKVGIADHILLKPGQLSEDEWEVVRQHPQLGADIIGNHESRVLQVAREIALSHHEKWDGSGYPNSLGGAQIPLSGRITAIADVFDALTSPRPHKEAWSVNEAVRLIDQSAGQHFDPDLVHLFHEVLPQVLEVREQFRAPGA